MTRLADYFVVVGYEKERDGGACGKILQKFPENDWDDVPFPQGIEHFCQPGGWFLSSERLQPTFCMSVLTDIEAERHYCACLTFTEALRTKSSLDDSENNDSSSYGSPRDGGDPVWEPGEEGEDCEESASPHSRHSFMFAPKSLVLISRLNYVETLKNCLGIIYTAYIDSLNVQLETLVGNIIGFVVVPPPGGRQVRFSIGAGDRQALQPPLSETIPCSGTSVALLFKQIGIHNVIQLLCAALTDCKVLFYSSSYNRLTEACSALIALLFPLKYSYVYIPVLPSSLLEVLNTPTPFIMGVHYSMRAEVADLLDVIVADLDGGHVAVPEHVNLPLLPDHIYHRVHYELTLILDTSLHYADNAFTSSSNASNPFTPRHSPVMVDKQIRAIFLRLFAQLFMGYRSCLTLIRIHPKPVITFNKGMFLFERGLMQDPFLTKVLGSMSLQTFVYERGPPFRVIDEFDMVCAEIQEKLQAEERKTDVVQGFIEDISKRLYLNETPNSSQPYQQKIPLPCEGAHTRTHQLPFPTLEAKAVEEIIEEGKTKSSLHSKQLKLNVVPCGPPPRNPAQFNIAANNARRLEVLATCVDKIFENKITDAKKTYPAVLRSLKSRVVRNSLTVELNKHVDQNRAMLESVQFDLIVRLMNCALQEDMCNEEYSVAKAILPLAASFCRKLCTGVIQFSYTCVQEHPVWASQHFWETAFYRDVEKNIKQLYIPSDNDDDDVDSNEVKTAAERPQSDSTTKEKLTPEIQVVNGMSPATGRSEKARNSYVNPHDKSALEIAANQMRFWPQLTDEGKQEREKNEEGIVYSQAIHFANQMVYMRIPLDTSKGLKSTAGLEGESGSSNVTSSVTGSDSYDGYDDGGESSDIASGVVRFVARFVDKVCTEGGVSNDHLKALHQMIPVVVDMHIDTLEAVYRESKRLPPIRKPKILGPKLLHGEKFMIEGGLRGYLLPDGREEGTGGSIGGPTLLPAEGAIFITNYRIVFKGAPCDLQVCEHVVVRSFPLSAMTREKKISVGQGIIIEHNITEAIQLRSATFELMKITFDEEVNPERIEMFRKMCHRFRFPSSIYQTFAFNGITPAHAIMNQEKHKSKHTTLKKFASKTLFMARKKQDRPTSKKQKYILPSEPLVPQRATLPKQFTMDTLMPDGRPNSMMYDDDELSIGSDSSDFTRNPSSTKVIEESEIEITTTSTLKASDYMSVEKLGSRFFVQDYKRLGLGNLSSSRSKSSDSLCVSDVNIHFNVCRSYPAVVVIPSSLTPENLRKLAKYHRSSRFPVITWRHSRTKALLLRCSGFHGKSVMGMMKSVQNTSGTSSETSKSVEQERFFSAVVDGTPMIARSDSLVSLNSLLNVPPPESPEILHRPGTTGGNGSPHKTTNSSFSRTLGAFRSSGGKGVHTFKPRLSGLGNGSVADLVEQSATNIRQPIAKSQKAAFYIFGEKSQMKALKSELLNTKCDFIPYEFFEVRHVKASFKKLMRACVPSAPLKEEEQSFYKLLEESDWLQQISRILQLAGAVVDLMDIQGSSVMISMEDGSDFTSQVTSIAELCLDPYYRTIDGFKTLIDKEWLAFGHRFTHRSNQTVQFQSSGFAPIFLQFLDAVHQILNQFPLSFEFNHYFLKMLAYHHCSNRFRTFMMDCELERYEIGNWLVEEKAEGSGGSTASKFNNNYLLWDYIDKLHAQSPIFYNFQFTPTRDNVLRPFANISCLKVWDYYLQEDLHNGPVYDLELTTKATDASDVEEQAHLKPTGRKMVNGCYGSVKEALPDTFTWLMEEVSHLESDLGHKSVKWKFLWDRMGYATSINRERRTSLNTQAIKAYSTSAHKKNTVDILMQGRLTEGGKNAALPHQFEPHNYMTPVQCDLCSQVVYGVAKSGMAGMGGMKCTACGYNCHEKCQVQVPKQCTKSKSPRKELGRSESSKRSTAGAGAGGSSSNSHKPVETVTIAAAATVAAAAAAPAVSSETQASKSNSSVVTSSSSSSTKSPGGSRSITPQSTPKQERASSPLGSPAVTYAQFSSSPHSHETRTHEGYLWKRGALLKGWKQRWFVLDSNKHQLRYYETENDEDSKGHIDLSEVESVIPAPAVVGAPKRTHENAFFDLKTTRRTYYFIAKNKQAAEDWINKITEFIN